MQINHNDLQKKIDEASHGLASGMKVRSYRKGEYIFHEGDHARYAYIVLSGTVKTSKYTNEGKETVSAIYFKNQIFGETELLFQTPREYHAKVIEDYTRLQLVTIRELFEIPHLQSNKDMVNTLSGIMISKIMMLEENVKILKNNSAVFKVSRYIYNLAVQIGIKIGCFEIMISNPMRHKDIANILGLTRQTVTQTLNQLKKENLIYFDKRKILVRDMDQLKNLIYQHKT